MSFLISIKDIPNAGETVTKVIIDAEYNVGKIKFNSGKEVIISLTRDHMYGNMEENGWEFKNSTKKIENEIKREEDTFDKF